MKTLGALLQSDLTKKNVPRKNLAFIRAGSDQKICHGPSDEKNQPSSM